MPPGLVEGHGNVVVTSALIQGAGVEPAWGEL